MSGLADRTAGADGRAWLSRAGDDSLDGQALEPGGDDVAALADGAPRNPKDVGEFVRQLNAAIGGHSLFKHGDIQSGVLGRAEGADLAYLQKPTILIGHGESAIMENGLVFFNDEWRATIEGLMTQPNLK